MIRCSRISTDLEYDSRIREREDITYVLLAVLHSDEAVEAFAKAPQEDESFGDEMQCQLSFEDVEDALNYTPVEGWDFRQALLEATQGQFGTDLLPMWHGWKAFMESPAEQARQIERNAKDYAMSIDERINMIERGQRAVYLRILMAKLLSQPGALDILPLAINEADVSAIDAMKALRDIS